MIVPTSHPNILLGISGSIAAYKSAELARELLRRGYGVQALMTRGATEFIGPSTLAAITGLPVLTQLFDGGPGERHVEVTKNADALLIAPATADLLARLTCGRASDIVCACALCFAGPTLVAPAMHPRMWQHPATRENMERLERRGVIALGPAHGPVASGDVGWGRMLEPTTIADRLDEVLSCPSDLKGRRLLVTAGPTVEDLDPVRFLSNRSSGKMGYALAEAARKRGADVELVSGPVTLAPPAGVAFHAVRSAVQMLEALRTLLQEPADALIMAAAVGDFRARVVSTTKLKREDGPRFELMQNPDIIGTLGGERQGPLPLLVAFAVESGSDDDIALRALEKLRRKGVDAIVVNRAEEALGSDTNRVQFITEQEHERLPEMAKHTVAHEILNRVAQLWATQETP